LGIPFSLHLVNLKDDETKNQLEIRTASKWAIKMHENPLEQETESIKLNWKKAIYLSPDAELPLLDFDFNSGGTSFILGGLIDRTRVKNATLNKFKSLEIDEL
jgi:Trm5-related predicted tRNA methylase